MARVTVEDCIDKIPNRYELLMVATQRAKDISSGAPIMVSRDNDKNPVIALREIAEEKVNIEDLQKSLVMGLQKYVEVEEPEEEEMEIQAAEKELAVLPSRLKKELAELDEPFSGFLIDNEVSDSMQVHGVDDDNLDLDSEDAADGDIDVDLDGDDELGFDEGGEMGDDGLDDFDEE